MRSSEAELAICWSFIFTLYFHHFIFDLHFIFDEIVKLVPSSLDFMLLQKLLQIMLFFCASLFVYSGMYLKNKINFFS